MEVETKSDLPSSSAIEMFCTFARFEYALKASGFYKGTREIEADWTKFAQDVASFLHANRSEKFSKAQKFLMEKPPKRQVVKIVY